MLRVMSDYMRATRGDGQLQDHIVIGIGQKRPPLEINLLQMRLGGEITQEPCSQRVLR